jgi:hypothetical protein
MDPHGTPGHADPHSHEVPTGILPFTDAEWHMFREDDMTAATRIVGLIVGIFLVGLVLYIGVLVSVLTRPVA